MKQNDTAAVGGEDILRRRVLLADYKNGAGRDFHQGLVTWHNKDTADAVLVQSVREALAERGCRLTALMDGNGKALYLAPGYMEECLAGLGLPVPEDLPSALSAAGIRPVNWKELAHGG